MKYYLYRLGLAESARVSKRLGRIAVQRVDTTWVDWKW